MSSMEVDAKPAEAAAGEETFEVPTETVYVSNLNENVKTKVIKQTLHNLFRNFGPVLGVVAHRNVRMRGQAFVAMDRPEDAARAVKDCQRFPLYGKPMKLAFAKTRADAVVKRKAPTEFDAHKEERTLRKKQTRYTNPLALKRKAQKQAKKAAAATTAQGGVAAPVVPSAAALARKADQMPDEYLPPNKILFIQNLPETATKEALEKVFKQYPNLFEVRTIPGRATIAFVEYMDEGSSSAARDALHNSEFEGQKMRVTFAKQ